MRSLYLRMLRMNLLDNVLLKVVHSGVIYGLDLLGLDDLLS